MKRRHGSMPVTLLLVLLLGAISVVRIVDLHWHQHLNTALTMDDGRIMPVTYVASAATPHLAADQDHDVSMFGDGGTAPLPVPLPDWGLALILLLPPLLALLRPALRLPHPEAAAPPGDRYRSPQLPPPLRGPPR
ncbi:hypothetical protein [Solimonas marina]|uniref:DUF2946 domain-containing protein n=1 Tax=Solimonas marina TaxID=2714601 RepID=A0A970B5S6_9GAMM|nr:hypothetical protein [Solimonas marina]NKF23707.1 hypothetical protein [Solimonas marina]